MVCVAVEIRDRASARRVRITADSIEQTLALAGKDKHDREVRLLLPVAPERFFARERTPQTTRGMPEAGTA